MADSNSLEGVVRRPLQLANKTTDIYICYPTLP